MVSIRDHESIILVGIYMMQSVQRPDHPSQQDFTTPPGEW